MTITYRNNGPWGSGKGSRLTSLEVDNSFYDLATRVGAIEALPIGVFIEDVSFTGGSITFILSDDSELGPFPLPVAMLNPVGPWQNDTHYNYLDLVTVRSLGLYLVLIEHDTPATGDFDPDAVDDESDQNPLYRIFVPLDDFRYDVAISLSGSTLNDPGALLAKIVIPRSIIMDAGLAGAYGHLGTAVDSETATAATSLSVGIYKGASLIGSITFEDGENLDGNGGQFGDITFSEVVEFDAGDLLVVRAIVADDESASDLSITIPATRTDV